jgi:hypothetical protein
LRARALARNALWSWETDLHIRSAIQQLPAFMEVLDFKSPCGNVSKYANIAQRVSLNEAGRPHQVPLTETNAMPHLHAARLRFAFALAAFSLTAVALTASY